MTTPAIFGDEFIINTTTVGGTSAIQDDVALSALVGGGFIASWTDQSNGSIIRAQKYLADGTPDGVEFIVDTFGSGAKTVSAAVGLSNGGFVVAWNEASGVPDNGGDGSNRAVRAKIFDQDGNPVGSSFLVNTTVLNDQWLPSIAALQNGRFVVTWQDNSATAPDTSSNAVRAQIYEADGTPVGVEFLVNSTTAGFQGTPDIVGLSDGKFVAIWRDGSIQPPDTDSSAVRARVFYADGTSFGSEFVANTSTTGIQWEGAVAALPGARFVVVYTDHGGLNAPNIRAQIWETLTDGNGNGVVSPVGTTITVNTTAAGNQILPDVAALADGSFVVVWEDGSQTGDDMSSIAVRGRVIGADGIPVSDEFVVNTTTTDAQERPAVTALADGRFVVGWTDDSNAAGGGTDIRGQIFDPRTGPVTLTDSQPALAIDNDWVGTAFADSMSGGKGDDVLAGEGGKDVLRGDGGSDKIYGGAARDTLLGGAGVDVIEGEEGNDSLFGGSGNDTIRGGSGNDKMIGGGGKDILTGGSDADVFVFNTVKESPTSSLRDVITDFEVGIDKIDVSALATGLVFIAAAPFSGTAPEVRYNTALGRILIDTDGNGTVDFSLELTGAPSITAGDLIL